LLAVALMFIGIVTIEPASPVDLPTFAQFA
jgi:hypothetical protein